MKNKEALAWAPPSLAAHDAIGKKGYRDRHENPGREVGTQLVQPMALVLQLPISHRCLFLRLVPYLQGKAVEAAM